MSEWIYVTHEPLRQVIAHRLAAAHLPLLINGNPTLGRTG